MLSILFFIFSYDVWFYISHIILHNKSLFIKIHKYHHKIEYKKMIFNDSYVAHYLEAPLQGAGIIFPLLFIEFDIYMLLYSMILINIRGMIRHDNRYIWLVGNHHILHHKHLNCNFGEYWLDVIFGTQCRNSDEYIKGIFYL